jgi:hypothetical protein
MGHCRARRSTKLAAKSRWKTTSLTAVLTAAIKGAVPPSFAIVFQTATLLLLLLLLLCFKGSNINTAAAVRCRTTSNAMLLPLLLCFQGSRSKFLLPSLLLWFAMKHRCCCSEHRSIGISRSVVSAAISAAISWYQLQFHTAASTARC